jgi:hypothetical protein
VSSKGPFRELRTSDCSSIFAFAENRQLKTANWGPNKKATRQLGGLFFQGRIVPTELEIHQNFLPESYEPQNRGVKQNFLIKYHYFQQLTGYVHKSSNWTKMGEIGPSQPLTTLV